MSNGSLDNVVQFQAKQKETKVRCIMFTETKGGVTCNLIERPDPESVIFDHYYDDEVNDSPY